MLEQLKKLPRSEQERLARQYGYELPGSTSNRSVNEKPQDVEKLQQPNRRSEEQQPEQKGEKKEPERFGLKLFDAEISTFAPVSNQPVPESYVLGADDQLLLQLFGKQSDSYTLDVSRDGNIMLPDIGPVNVAGLSFSTASELIVERIRSANIGLNAAVSMGQLRTINIFVAGEAKYPGVYAVSALTTVTQALFVAGGVSDIGSLREIEVKRAGETVARFDLYDLLLRGDSRNDVHLKHGDVLFIAPVKALAEVRGEVKRPAIYEVKRGETLGDLLAMAGGAKANGYISAAVLERYNEQRLRDFINVDLTKQADNAIDAKAGDVLRIAASSLRVENQLVLAGAVARPGFYAWHDGYRVTDIIRSLWSDLLLSADLHYALIVRQINSAGDIEVIQFDLVNALENPSGADNVQLKPRDTLVVFHHVDQFYQREKLNQYMRDTILEQLEWPPEQRWLIGDLASTAFTEIQKPVDPEAPEVVVTEAQKDTQLLFMTELEQQALLQATLSDVLERIYTDPKALALSSHFSRKELLYPILQKLRQQARANNNLKIVTVGGDVKVPGEYPLTVDATVTDLVAAAGGLNDSAYFNRAELSRTSGINDQLNGVRISHETIDLAAIFSGNAADVALQSRDRLNIFATPEWKTDREVTLSGEVRFPGVYKVRQGERLSDVIQRAGGLTDNAFAFGAVFTREQIRKKETAQMEKLLEQLKSDVATRALSTEQTQATPQDSMFLLRELGKIEPVGRLVINLEQIVAQNPQYDMPVEDKDMLFVPRQNRAITIVGEVQYAGTHRFDGSASVRNYLDLAGGLRKRADNDRVFIVRADGSVALPESGGWFGRNKTNLLPGDTIVVPLDTEYKDSLTLWGQITQIFYQSAIALAALNSF
ncbi:SLBB domain-containing protein [Rheinheimera sp. SM2107]|uniref:SLBB domain-containing protein n=2 Tax=Arsukibacterium indicum TaxID=2848612 RepID=A0ABS6MG69_9GAMM|nr:SLBB domain-containing protein [Arsukibacterium indicum]